jgi:hypothetical protein
MRDDLFVALFIALLLRFIKERIVHVDMRYAIKTERKTERVRLE